MTAFSILLRLLLSITLILNGSGAAMAHAGMTMAHAQHGAEAASTHDQPARVHIQASAAPDCHHMRAMPPAKADAPLALTSASDTTDGSTNCCQSADCRRGCTQYCSSAIAIPAIHDALIPRTGLTPTIQPGHVPPALPPLTRPPYAEKRLVSGKCVYVGV